MKRVEGYIDLCSVLNLPNVKDGSYDDEVRLLSELQNNPNVKILKFEYGINILFSFKYEGEEYFYSYDSLSTPLDELVFDMICDDLGIEHVDYDMASIGGLKGTLSKNYKIDGATYLSIYEIIKDNFNEDDLDELDIECYGYDEAKRRDISRYNSLEGIWASLYERYKKVPGLAEKLMSDIIDVFIVDVITGQNDRHDENLEIVELDSENVRIQPLFDNSRIFQKHPITVRQGLGVNNLNKKAPNRLLEENVTAFIKQCSGELVNRLKSSLWVLMPKNIERIFERIEKKIGKELDDKTKDEYRKKMDIQLDYLMELLEMEQIEEPKSFEITKK